MKNLNIYDLNNPYYLYEDIESIIDRIGELYQIDFSTDEIRFTSKIKLPANAFWVSDEATKAFNESVPVIKSLIKDVYSIIEGIFVAKNGKFDKPGLENKYSGLKELREFNNKLKHHNTKNVTFNIVSIVNIGINTFDCLVQYKYDKDTKISVLPLVKFFELFFLILEDQQLITIDRN